MAKSKLADSPADPTNPPADPANPPVDPAPYVADVDNPKNCQDLFVIDDDAQAARALVSKLPGLDAAERKKLDDSLLEYIATHDKLIARSIAADSEAVHSEVPEVTGRIGADSQISLFTIDPAAPDGPKLIPVTVKMAQDIPIAPEGTDPTPGPVPTPQT